jgi:hypothetical protein
MPGSWGIYRATWHLLEKGAEIGRAAVAEVGLGIAEAHAGMAIAWSEPDGMSRSGWVGLTADGKAGYAVIPDAVRGDEPMIVGSKRPGRAGRKPLTVVAR